MGVGDVRILDAPIDLGASKHGSDLGPAAIKISGLKARLESMGHKVSTTDVCSAILMADKKDIGRENVKFLDAIVLATTQLGRAVRETLEGGAFPLILGGDHSVALGSIAGAALWARERKRRLGVLYVDAHGDFNTSTTTKTGNIHGQCLAASAGLGESALVNLLEVGKKIDSKDICLFGVRDLDPLEKDLLKESGVKVLSISAIDKKGFQNALGEVRDFLSGFDAIHVSFDMDSLDPAVAPGTGIRVPAGLTAREALALMEEVSELGRLVSAEFVEVNPALDIRSTTAKLTVSLIARLLGERIY